MAELESGLAEFLRTRIPCDTLAVTDVHRHIEGFSWETWSATLRWTLAGRGHGRDVIVRRAPAAGLVGPYDVVPQWELNEVLHADSGVPVAQPLWLDAEGAATGRPLYVMERVEGDVPVQWNTDRFFADDDERHALGRRFAALGAAIHRFPVERLPSGLRGRGAAGAGEVSHWEAVYLRDRALPVPVLDLAFAWLRRHADWTSGRLALVHGDFRVGNFMVRDGEIVAMFDWELAHVGDPVEDVALAAIRLYRGRTGDVSGLLPLDDWLEAYADASGRPVPAQALRFWTVFGLARAAVTLITASGLFASGATRDLRYAALGHQVHYLLRFLLDELDPEQEEELRAGA